MQLIVGCDANAHHILWGCMDNNPQGECFMEYLEVQHLIFLINVTGLPLQLVTEKRL